MAVETKGRRSMGSMIQCLYIVVAVLQVCGALQVNFDEDAQPNSCGMKLEVNQGKVRLNATGNLREFEEGKVGSYPVFVCPVMLMPGSVTQERCRHSIMCVTLTNSFRKMWSQCFAGIKFKWYKNGKLFSERLLSCHMPYKQFLDESSWCSEVTNGKLGIEVFEYQDRRRVPYNILSETTLTCSSEPGQSFGLPKTVGIDQPYIIRVDGSGEPLAYGLVTGIMLALGWLFVFIGAYIYYKVNPPQKR